jgi:hypothetical protein
MTRAGAMGCEKHLLYLFNQIETENKFSMLLCCSFVVAIFKFLSVPGSGGKNDINVV